MERLLRWGVQNTTNDAGSAPAESNAPTQPLDPGVIDAILGRPDSELMKEDVEVALDATKSEDQRVEALDHLEMLIELIDNANDLERLGLWEPLHSFLTTPGTPHSITMHALWVIGTALQNNPAAQDAYSKFNPLPVIFSFLVPSEKSNIKIRSKVIYCLSGLLKHNAPEVARLSDPEVDGWPVIRQALRDPDIQTRRKLVFLLNTLLIPTVVQQSTASATSASVHTPDSRSQPNEPVHANSHAATAASPSRTNTSDIAQKEIVKHGIVSQIVKDLVEPIPYGEDGEFDEADEEFEEKAVRLIHTFVNACGLSLDPADRRTLATWLDVRHQQHGDTGLAERWGWSQAELQEFRKSLTGA